jgi:tRNA U34 5-methylaminomethyl-2-thiouridine-forming methyltransferase MnmC
MRQLAEYLSGHGVASLRYDKVGTGRTGLGPYQTHPGDVGTAVYTAGAKAALRFLVDRPATADDRVTVYGLGEGTTHAIALAVSAAVESDAPKVHALGLLQPLPGRYLDLITTRVRNETAAAVESGAKTQQQADGVVATWNTAVAQVRDNGTVPPGQLPDGLSAILNPVNVKAVAEADAVDPLAEAAKIAAGTPVLLTCSDSDAQAMCTDIKPLADALGHTALTRLELKGVNHVLRDDAADNVADYAKQAPLSPQLTSVLDRFVTE